MIFPFFKGNLLIMASCPVVLSCVGLQGLGRLAVLLLVLLFVSACFVGRFLIRRWQIRVASGRGKKSDGPAASRRAAARAAQRKRAAAAARSLKFKD